LVTNETWNDFWLNEGFTVYFENRIMEEIIGKNGADNLALIEFFELQEELERIENSGHPEDAHLFLDLDGRDPDDGMTDVAYVKGAFFLKTLEANVGRDKMDVFLMSYFDHFKFTSVNTDKFVSYLEKELLQKHKIDFNYKEWIYQPGIPESCINLKSDGFENVKEMAITFANGETDESWDKVPFNKRSNYSVQEWLTFIRHLPSDINVEKMAKLDKHLAFSEWTNAEIQFEWFMKSISSNYTNAYPYLESFLEKIGRRKFILPLYEALYKNVNTRKKALEWFKDYNKNYHAVSSNSIAEALEL
jgi:leukotriene-A4 hydrolase